MTVDLSGLPRRVRVAVGERAEIGLPSFAGSGNVWTAEPVGSPATAVAAVAVRTDPAARAPVRDPGGEPPSSYAAPVVAVVAGRMPGTARWRLVLARPFAPRPPTAVHELTVDVHP